MDYIHQALASIVSVVQVVGGDRLRRDFTESYFIHSTLFEIFSTGHIVMFKGNFLIFIFKSFFGRNQWNVGILKIYLHPL